MKALAALALAALLPGCVAAAVIPLAAGGTIGKKQLGPKRKKQAPPPVAPAASDTRLTLLPAGSTLPPPGAAAATPAKPVLTGWRALVRHVASAMSTGASCADGTTAVLIDAAVAGAAPADRDAATASLNALRTMGASITFVASDPAAARPTLTSAGMADPATTIARPADVRAIARTGCVLASGGGTRADYTGLVWFALPGTPRTLTAATEPKP